MKKLNIYNMKKVQLILFALFTQIIFAQNPSDIDPLFNVSSGFDNNVTCNIMQNDGKIIVGGQFTNFQGQSQNRLIRLNSDGSKDISFNVGSGFNQYVGCLAIQNDRKILVGGGFSTYQGQSLKSLVRLNIDGSIDNSFSLGTGFNGVVSGLAIKNDGRVFVGGNFSTFNNITQKNLILLNSNGTVDSSFNISESLNGVINDISIQNDEKIIVAGGFTTYLGQTQKSLIKFNLDGTKDNTFDIGTGFNQSANHTLTQPNNKIIVSGWFTTFQGQSQNSLIRLNSDGSKDNSFDIGTGFNGNTYPLVLQPNGKIIVGGQFTSYKGQFQNYLIRLNSDGSKDSSFDIGTGFDNRIFSIIKQSDDKLIIGGVFVSYQNQSQIKLTRLIGGESLSNNEFNQYKVLLYPNPVKNILYIQRENNESFLRIKLYSCDGKLIKEEGSNSNQLNLENIESGIYLIKFETQSGFFTKQIVKTN